MLKHELLKELEPEILVRIKKGFDLYKMPSDHKPVRGDHGQCTLPEKQLAKIYKIYYHLHRTVFIDRPQPVVI